MSSILQLFHDGSLAVGGASVLYAITINVTALTAIFAPSASRRRDARGVLAVLLHRRSLD
jgi:hypothetical protein